MGALFVLPPDLRLKLFWRELLSRRGLLLLLFVLVQFIPIYFQLKFTADTSQGINAIGGLRQFHGFVLLAGVGLLLAFWWSKQIDDGFKKLILIRIAG